MSKAEEFAKAEEDSVGEGGLFGRYVHTDGKEYVTYNGEFFKDNS